MLRTLPAGLIFLGLLIFLISGPPRLQASTPGTASEVGKLAAPPIRLYQKVLMLGRLPYINLNWMKSSHEALMDYLKREIGLRDARLVTAKDYKGILESLSRGTIDVAWLSAITYTRYRKQYRLKPLVKTGKGDVRFYHGIIIARRDSLIRDWPDLKGKRLAFVDPESSSGYVFPLALLKKSGIDPQKDCTQVVFLKKHDEVVKQVMNRNVDVGACLEEAPVMYGQGRLPDDLIILGKTEPIPSDPLVCREDMPQVLQDKIRTALLKISSGSLLAKELLAKEFGIDSFLPVQDSDYEPVSQILKTLKSNESTR
jgi:phosphate/phosphite/phosphonate ABC transporter binding protein